jgi:hypothetical protein
MMTTEPVIYPESNGPPVFPGAISLPYHAVLSPIDRNGCVTPGSSKGKRVSTVVRGLSREENLKNLESLAVPLPLNRPKEITSDDGLLTYKYENGLLVKQFPFDKKPVVDISWNFKSLDKENVEILKTAAEQNLELIKTIQAMFSIPCDDLNNVKVTHLIKKDNGFSKIALMDLDIPPSSTIVLVNSSRLPEGYKYYNITEDLMDKEISWMQLYQFKPEMAILTDHDTFSRLSLTPLEELIYREETSDCEKTEGVDLFIKPVTQIDIFAFPNATYGV